MDYRTLGVAIAGLGLAGLAVAPAIQAQEGPVPPPLDAQTAEELRPEAGKYRANIKMRAIDIPGAPPEVANMMGSMFSRDFTYCLTPADAEEGFRAMTDRSNDDGGNPGNCSYERFDVTGGRIDALMSCNADGRVMRMAMTGTGTSTSSKMTMTMTGDMGMGDGAITMDVEHERLGAC